MVKEPKRKHFIAVLGTGSYSPCTYFYNGQECDTKFVQEAVLKLACKELLPGDRITICLTKDARGRNWEDRAYSAREMEIGKGSEGEMYQGLHSVLLSLFPDKLGIQIEEKDIATGQNSREMAQMFSEIYDVIDEDEDIYFDITHGLRNIPMLMMTILEYAKVTKNISIGGIYYGAFEVGEKDAETRNKKVPIFDLTFYHTILSWANAANSFIRYGHAEEINDLVKEKWASIARMTAQEPRPNQRNWTKKEKKRYQEEREQKLSETTGNLQSVANYLQEFTAAIETGRGNAENEKGIRAYYEKYDAQQRITSEHLVEEYYPFRELLGKIDQKMGGFKEAKTNFQIGMATVDWCIEHNLIAQGYTAFDETLKSFLCEKIGVPQNEEFWRETVVKRLCTTLYPVVGKTREEQQEKFEEWKEFVQNCEPGKSAEAMEKGTELFHLLFDHSKHKELLSLMDGLGKKRNDINHFGFTKSTAPADSLKKELKNMVDSFKKIRAAWGVEAENR